MPATQAEARDQILALVKTATDALPTLRVIWDDTAASVPSAETPNPVDWARVTVAHFISQQSSLAGVEGTRRFTRRGQVTIQMFLVSKNGLNKADVYGPAVQQALEGECTEGGVWFRDVSVQERGEDGPWYRVDVVASFEYDTVR